MKYSDKALLTLIFACFFFIFSSFAVADTPLKFEAGDTLKEIKQKIEHNGYSFTVAANPIFNMSDEKKSRFFSRRTVSDPKALRKSVDPGPLPDYGYLELPEFFDWRSFDDRFYIGPIRNQGSCGSCYAFGASAAAEGAYNFVTSKFDGGTADFSEAFIAFCLSDHYPANFSGCDGSDYDYRELDGLVDFGIADETDYPYQDFEQECQVDPYPQLIQFKSWHRIPCEDIDAIKRAIMAFGVVDASVLVTGAFSAYSSGVYEDQNTYCEAEWGDPCYYAATNHVIALVGWDDNPPEGGGGCWILRNSWGDAWGEDGYMRIRYDSAHVACEGAYLVYEGEGPVIVVTSPTNISGTTITLNAMINPKGLDADFHIEYGTGVECLSSTAPAPAGNGVAFENFSAQLINLTPQTTYHYRVVAQNAQGTSYSILKEFTTAGDPHAPDARTSSASVNMNQAKVSGWINPHGAYTDYYFEYGLNDQYGFSSELMEESDGTQDIIVSTVLTSLVPLTTYHYRIVAENDYGETQGLDRTFVTGEAAKLPLATTEEAYDVSSSQAALEGVVNPNNVETSVPAHYCFEYGLTDAYGSATEEKYAGAGVSDVFVNETISGLEALTTYHFRMVAINSVGATYGADMVFTTTQTIFYEDFDHEGYAPLGWTQEIISGTTQWVYSMGYFENPNGYAALFCPPSFEAETMLITPKIDLSGVVSPVLSLVYDLGDFGDMQVYYKENPDDPWLTEDSFYLPWDLNECVITMPHGLDQIYLAFDGYSGESSCIVLDSVSVSEDAWASGGPIIETGVISDVTCSTAICAGNVISDNNSPITARGVCWSQTAIPTINDSHIVETGQTGEFTSLITGLLANTDYYARAYATNGVRTSYGCSKVFKTENLPPPEALEATDVTANQFTANWSEVEGATGYYIDVWESGAPLARRSRKAVEQAGSPVTQTGPGMTTVEFSFNSGHVDFVQDSGFLAVSLEDGVLPDDTPGTPWLPAQYINIMIPPNALVTGINVLGEEVSLKKDALVYPVQPPQSPSLPKIDFVQPDPAAYAAIAKTPLNLAVMQGVHTMRGLSFVSIRVNPIRYVPADRELYLATSISIKINYEENNRKSMLTDPLFQDVVNSMVVNPDWDSDVSARKTIDSVDYLIITSQDLAGAFGALITHRQDFGGLNCEIKTVEDIEAQYPGLDTQEKIRNCISEYMEQKGLIYVALGGDDTVVPARVCPVRYAYYEDEMPTDLYYSALDGDWDDNSNLVYGEAEDNVDMAPDVIVGRIPVRTVEQVNAYIAKLVDFEIDPQALSKMLLTGAVSLDTYYDDDRPTDLMDDGHLEFLDPDHMDVSDSEMWTRRLYRDHIRPNYEPETLGFLFDTLTSWDSTMGGDYEMSTGTVMAIYNQGWTHLFNNSHGNVQVWAIENYDCISHDNIESMTGLTPFVYTTACLTNYFNNESDPCLSEAFIRNPEGGALTYVGSSNYGWFVSDYPPANETSMAGESMHYAIRYYTRMFEVDFISSGEAFALHKADLISMCITDGTPRWIQFGLNLMGDPAIMTGGRYAPGYYRLYVGDVTSFEITGLNSSSNYHYRVSADDQNSIRNNSATIDVQTADMDINLSNNQVPENQPIGTYIGTLSTPDPAGTHTFEFAVGEGDEDNGFFTIDNDSLQTAAIFDFETQDQYNIRVQTNDGLDGIFAKPFTVTVTNIDEADIFVDKIVDDAMPAVGGEVIYTVFVTNNGPDNASGLEIDDFLPAELEYQDDSSGGAYNHLTGVWTIGALANGDDAVITITAAVIQSGLITNTAAFGDSISVEPNPADNQAHAVIDTDTDGDGIADRIEEASCLFSDDTDTDDDGIVDGLEDVNGDGVVDPGETDPCNVDSDNDGVQDGTETGLTAGDIGPDTDAAVFIPDLDPATTTDPLNPDTDNDGWMDGEEDANANGRVDEGETSPNDNSLPLPTPPEIIQTIPHDNAGIDDDTRVPNNTCFAVYFFDEDGIDITDGQSIVFGVNDGQIPAYERDLDNADVIRVVKLTQDPDTGVTELWVVYDRSEEAALDQTYVFSSTVNVTVDATDRRGGQMDQAAFAFNVETEQEHNDAEAARPATDALAPGDPALGGDYDAGIKAQGPELDGAMIVYDSTGPVTPGFGPLGEVPLLELNDVKGVGAPMNLEPPSVFNPPVKLFIPCPGHKDVSDLSVFLYNGQNWVLACNSNGAVTPGGRGWVVPESRVNHNNGNPSTIEIMVYHFTGVQAAKIDEEAQSPKIKGSDNCFISTIM